MRREMKGIDGSPADEFRRGVEIVGGQAATARLLNVTQPTIWRWLKSEKSCPAEHVAAFEKATSIHRRRLRPDLYGESTVIPLPDASSGAPA